MDEERVDTPIGAYKRPEKRYAPNPDADPDLERWQRDRWAPHGDMNEPAPANGMRDFPEDGSLHDRSRKFDDEIAEWVKAEEKAQAQAKAEAEKAEKAEKAETKPKRGRAKKDA